MNPLAWIMPRLPIVSIGLAVSFAIACGFAGCEHQGAARYKAERTAARSEAATCIVAASSKDGVIDRLRAANDGLLSTAQDQLERLQTSAIALEKWKTLAANQAERLRNRESSDRAKPDCKLVLATELDASCPALADGVRERATRHL